MTILRTVIELGTTETVTKATLKLVAPAIENRTVVPPCRGKDPRSRKHLTETEIGQLIAAAKGNRSGLRDATMIIIAFRHGLRAASLSISAGIKSTFTRRPCTFAGSRTARPALTRSGATSCARRRCIASPESPFMFVSERGAPFTTAGFARMVERAGATAGLAIKPHAHMLRHACGYALANAGHDTRALQTYRARQYPAHHALYRAFVGAFQGLLARLRAAVALELTWWRTVPRDGTL